MGIHRARSAALASPETKTFPSSHRPSCSKSTTTKKKKKRSSLPPDPPPPPSTQTSSGVMGDHRARFASSSAAAASKQDVVDLCDSSSESDMECHMEVIGVDLITKDEVDAAMVRLEEQGIFRTDSPEHYDEEQVVALLTVIYNFRTQSTKSLKFTIETTEHERNLAAFVHKVQGAGFAGECKKSRQRLVLNFSSSLILRTIGDTTGDDIIRTTREIFTGPAIVELSTALSGGVDSMRGLVSKWGFKEWSTRLKGGLTEGRIMKKKEWEQSERQHEVYMKFQPDNKTELNLYVGSAHMQSMTPEEDGGDGSDEGGSGGGGRGDGDTDMLWAERRRHLVHIGELKSDHIAKNTLAMYDACPTTFLTRVVLAKRPILGEAILMALSFGRDSKSGGANVMLAFESGSKLGKVFSSKKKIHDLFALAFGKSLLTADLRCLSFAIARIEPTLRSAHSALSRLGGK